MIVKENMLDVLMHLFDNYLEEGADVGNDRESVKTRLMGDGFTESAVDKAFSWLEGLVPEEDGPTLSVLDSQPSSIRVYTANEQGRLSAACRGFLLGMEEAGLLDDSLRETIIEQAIALDADELDVEQLRWVTQLVLSNQPESSDAFTQMNGMVVNQVSEWLH